MKFLRKNKRVFAAVICIIIALAMAFTSIAMFFM